MKVLHLGHEVLLLWICTSKIPYSGLILGVPGTTPSNRKCGLENTAEARVTQCANSSTPHGDCSGPYASLAQLCNSAFTRWWVRKGTVATLIPSGTRSCKQGTSKPLWKVTPANANHIGRLCTLTDAGTLQKEGHEATQVPHEPYAH